MVSPLVNTQEPQYNLWALFLQALQNCVDTESLMIFAY